MSTNGPSLYVLAHQDDEYAYAVHIARDVAAGRRPIVFFLTSGATATVAEPVRTAESRAVLGALGVAADDVIVVGAPLEVASDQLPARLEETYAALREAAQELPPPVRIYAPAWEGGHPDHDATHLAAARLAREFGVVELYEAALYNGYRRVGPFFRVFSFCDGARVGDDAGPRVALRDVPHYGLLCWRYPSQRRTWIGLFPAAFARFALRRRHAVRAVSATRALIRPHRGALYYERRWGLSYERFVELTGSGFIGPDC